MTTRDKSVNCPALDMSSCHSLGAQRYKLGSDGNERQELPMFSVHQQRTYPHAPTRILSVYHRGLQVARRIGARPWSLLPLHLPTLHSLLFDSSPRASRRKDDVQASSSRRCRQGRRKRCASKKSVRANAPQIRYADLA